MNRSGAVMWLAWALDGRLRGWRWWYWAGVAALFVDEVWINRLHWQTLPALLGMLIGGWVFFGKGKPWGKTLGVLAAIGLAIVSLGLMWVLPLFDLPAPTGKYEVGTRTVHWTEDGGRELAVQIWYPAVGRDTLARYVRWQEVKPQLWYWSRIRTNSWQDAAVRDGSWPVIIVGHMWGGRRTQETFLAEELASHGYVVASADHPGNSARVEMSDGSVVKSTMSGALSDVEGTSAEATKALWAKELAVWVKDDEFVLDRMTNEGWLRGHADMSRVGALGHSFGGASSMALLGKDARVKCAVNMDGWTFNGLANRTTQPVLFLYTGAEEVRVAESGAEGELDRWDNAAVDGSLAQYGGMRAFIAHTQHLDFTDQTLVSPLQRLTYTGPIKGERVRAILRRMVVGFFDEELKGEGEVPGFAEVDVQTYKGKE